MQIYKMTTFPIQNYYGWKAFVFIENGCYFVYLHSFAKMSQSPSQSAPIILTYQVNLIFF